GTNVNLGANALTMNNATNGTFGGSIGGTGGVTLSGPGTETLTGANTYTGGTTINGGTLALGSGGSLASTSPVDLAGTGATFDISNATAPQSIGTLTGVNGTNVNLGANALTMNNATNGTYGGTIGGTGGVTLNGPGTETLTGANTYTGGTTINGGTLAIGTGGSLASTSPVDLTGNGATFDISNATTPQSIGTLTGVTGSNVNLGANALTMNNATNGTYAGTIGGNGGALTVTGPGTETLTGANTYTGGTNLNGGNLAVGNNSALGTGALNVSGAGTLGASAPTTLANAVNLGKGSTLTVNGSNDLGLSGVIAGPGELVQNSTGTTTLSGANTYTGGTLIDSGTLAIGPGGSLASTAPVLLAEPGATFDISGATAPQSIGTLSGANGTTVNLGATALTLTGSNGTFGGALTGTGPLTLSGAGTELLTGTSTLSGPTTVQAGTLAVNGSLANSPVTVQNGATVTGSGTIGGLYVSSGGTASVPQPGQTLHVAGNVTFQPGSTFQVGVNPQQSGMIAATGNATINGGTVQAVAAQATYQANTTYKILSAGAGVTGQFSGVNSTYAFVTPTLSYDANDVYLRLATNGTPFTSVATTPDQSAVGGALGTLGAGSPLYTALLTTDAPTARAALTQLDGDLYATTKSALLLDSRYVREAMVDRARQGVAPSSGPLAALSQGGGSLCDNGAAHGDAKPGQSQGSADACVGGTPYRPVVWGRVYGSSGRLSGNGNASGVDRHQEGFIAGADMAVNDQVRVGLAGGVTHGSLDADDNASASINSYYLGLYGGAQYGALGLRGGVAQTWYRIDTNRNPAFTGFSDHDSAGYGANSTQVFGEVGYALPAGAYAFEPFANLSYVHLHTNGFTESGGAAALSGGATSQGVVFSTLGVRAATQLNVNTTGNLGAHAMVGWRHAFGDTSSTSAFAFNGGSSAFQISGVPLARDSAVLELGLDVNATKNLTLGVSYSGQFGNSMHDNALLGNILWKF
uniref:autotransporter outer membrane beta-barrel domain-containing protein n=1 Tax=Burkholderia guangdongensis TaxID=1792500 RepID=UPI0015CE6FD4